MTRIRNKTLQPIINDYQHLKNGVPDGPPNPCVLFSGTRNMEDVVTSNYAQRIARGDIINNPCTFHSNTTMCGGGSYVAIGTSAPFDTFSNTGAGSLTYHISDVAGHTIRGTVPPNLVMVEGDLAQAKADAISRIDPVPYNLGEDVFEFRETLKFLRNPIKPLLALGKQFKKDARKHKNFGTNLNQALSDTWLSYRFAATPLIRSVLDVIEIFTDPEPPTPPRAIARGSSKTSDEASDEPNLTIYTYSRKGSYESKVTAQILYEVINPMHSLRTATGFRASDLPETLWAIVPYSFMVDRIVNISDFVRGMTNLSNPYVKVLAASTTKRTKTVSTVKLLSQNSPTNFSYTILGDEHVTDDFLYERAPWIPYWSDTFPPSELKGLVDDATKTLDLVTLAVSAWT
jgi:hypothetical protein